MRKFPIGWSILCLVIHSATLASASNSLPKPANHEQALINAFEVMCTLELPNFDHVRARATALRMTPVQIQPLPLPTGVTLRRGGWNGKLTTGPFSLLVDETTMPAGVITTCAVASRVTDADAFRAEAMRELKLSTEPRPTFIGGHRAFIFRSSAPNRPGLVIEDLKPSGQEGVMLKATFLKAATKTKGAE